MNVGVGSLFLYGLPPPTRLLPTVLCSSRNPGKPRGPLTSGRILTNESLRAVQDLKRSKHDPHALSHVFQAQIPRLLKADLLAVLAELQRQNECHLALQIFDLVRNEVWYKPDATLYEAMLATLNRNKLIEELENLFYISKEEGLQPSARVYTEVLGAYMRFDMPLKAMEMYKNMKVSGCFPSEVYTFLITGLERHGLPDLAATVREDCVCALSGEPEKSL